MQNAPIWHHTLSHQDGVCTVALIGEVDYSCSEDLATLLLEQLSRPNVTGVAVDMSDVRFFDSTAITSLLTAYNAAVTSGRIFCVVNPSPRIQRVFKVTGLLDLLTTPR